MYPIDIEPQLQIVLILTVGFAFAAVLGYLTHLAKLSPILGFLLAGFLIGPFSPGFVADLQMSEQLAEIGVILMMFGVGLHFKWHELMSVKYIAIPGAIGQTLATTVIGAALIYYFGWSIEAGIIIGFAIGVASTVVLVRVLNENNLLRTKEGHIAVGWLIVEDVMTVVAMIIVPTLGASSEGAQAHFSDILWLMVLVIVKFTLMAAIMFTLGSRIVIYLLSKVVTTQSHELFTISILALTFVIAMGSSFLFGTSIALGAFIAGMVIGQSKVRHQVYLNSMPLKDTFVVIFFLSVGMLFNPGAIMENFWLFAGILAIVLIIKPVVAMAITLVLKYPFKTALTVAIALAQIGEFSFILIEESMKYKIVPDEGYDIIVACSLISISMNPLLFKFFIDSKKHPKKPNEISEKPESSH